MLQEAAKQMFKELQGWFLPVSEVAACSLAVGNGINFAPIRRKLKLKIKK